MIFSTLNRYIAFRVLRSILLAFLVVTSIIMLVDFVEGARELDNDEQISAGTLFLMTALKTPNLIEQTIPFVVLFGVMGALYSLNKRSELIVLRASGLSAWRFLTPALFVTGVIGILWATAFNPIAATSMSTYQRMSQNLSGQTPNPSSDEEIWLRERTDLGQVVIHAQGSDVLNRSLSNVTFYFFETDAQNKAIFKNRIDAENAKLLNVGFWQLTNARESAEGEITRISPALSLPTTVTATELQEGSQTNNLPSFWKLPAAIARIRDAGFSTAALRMQYHKLLSLPLTLIAMTFIAAGVSMQLTRQGGTFSLMIIGGAVGFSVFFIDNITSAFGQAGSLPVIVAAWAIPVLVLLIGMAYLAKIEDG